MSAERIDVNKVVQNLSEAMKRSKIAYHRVFDNMPEDKARIIMQMTLAWTCAGSAYDSAMGLNGEETDEIKIMSCGLHASRYMVHFRIIQNLLGNESLENTLKKMDDTSKWLKERDWSHIPEPIDEKGCIHRKTSADVHADMKRYSDARSTLLRSHDSGEEDSSKRR